MSRVSQLLIRKDGIKFGGAPFFLSSSMILIVEELCTKRTVHTVLSMLNVRRRCTRGKGKPPRKINRMNE